MWAVVSGRRATFGVSVRCGSISSGGSRQSFADDRIVVAVGCGAWLTCRPPTGVFDRIVRLLVVQTRPNRSRISVWISSVDRVASLWATNSLR